MVLSKSNKYIYVADGTGGIFILNRKKLPEFDIISRLEIDGWVNNILPVYNDKYILGINTSYGQLFLANIEDIYNPVLYS
jgi:hypothetical protein